MTKNQFCSYCDSYIKRGIPCKKKHKTIVPFNVSCNKWKPRNKNKLKVL